MTEFAEYLESLSEPLSNAQAKAVKLLDALCKRVEWLEQRREPLEAVLRLLQADPHLWSSRHCQTCRAITDLTGREFGCCTVRKTP